MLIKAKNNRKQDISVEEFFAKYLEFSYNKNLVEQTTRILKMLLRHPDAVEYIAVKLDDRFAFSVFGMNRKYTVVFTITNQSIILLNIM